MANTIMETAQKLGQLIGESDEKKRAVEAADALRNNEEATKIMEEYNTLRHNEMAKFQEKEPSKEDFEAFQTLMQNEFKRLAENSLIAEYIDANKAYESLVKRVNGVLAYYINGEEEESGCGGNCSSCGGCH